MEINKSAPTQQRTSLPHKNVPKDNEASESKAAAAPLSSRHNRQVRI